MMPNKWESRRNDEARVRQYTLTKIVVQIQEMYLWYDFPTNEFWP